MQDLLKDKKNLVTYLILAILILAIPLTVKLVQTQLQFRSRAAGNEITCPGSQMQGQNCVTKTSEVELLLDSPFGRPQ